MRIELDNGDVAWLWISHKEVLRSRYKRRATVITLDVPARVAHVTVKAVCIPPDQFVKKKGREIAGRKLWKTMVEHYLFTFTKDDRRRILEQVFDAKNHSRERLAQGEKETTLQTEEQSNA